VTIRQEYDVLQRRLRVQSADAGTRLSVADAGGKSLRGWDSRGQTIRPRYDAIRRPTHLYVVQAGTERLLLRTVFGEALDVDPSPRSVSRAQEANLRGQPYQLYDCAGLATNVRFDFKGNLLEMSRRVAIDYTTDPNWKAR